MIDFNLRVLDDLHKAQEEGVPIPILMPGSGSVIMTIHVTGPDSKAHIRAIERASEDATARAAQTPFSPEEQRQNSSRFLARICTGWDAKDASGQDIHFNEDAAAELFDRYPLIKEQVDAAAANRARFTKRSPTA